MAESAQFTVTRLPFTHSSPNGQFRNHIEECQQLRAEGQRLRVTSKRLRLDCVKARLDLAERFAQLTDPKKYGEKLATVFRTRALDTFTNVRKAICNPGWTDMERHALEPRLNRLQLLLTVLGILHEGSKNSPEESADLHQPSAAPVGGDWLRGAFSIRGQLTNRQREALGLFAEGKSAKEVAFQLGISVKTAQFHKSNIMRELDLHTTADLVKYAIRHGMTQC